ncbi:MAG: restriction endonuclease subunit S [Flavobacteriales bacterium]|jgi:type I restriction enzyme S subunit|nr:restriction endonuclease subunit S [Flavobacteriales bacterium]
MSFMHDLTDIDFPEEWSMRTIEEVAHFSRGLSWAKRDETDKDSGSLVLSIPNIRDGYIDFESKFNHYLGCNVPEAKRLSIGDIVFVGSSGSLQNVGRNAKVRALPGPTVAFASFTFKATPDQELVDPDFFYYLVNSDLVPFADYCSRAADGKYNFQLVDFKSNQQLRLPPQSEQQRIAQVLSTVQQAIEQQERLIRTTTELKLALMQKLFTEGLHGEAQKETEIGLVPESWEVVALSNIGRVVTGTTPSTKVPEYYSPEEADFVAPADIGNTRQVKDSEKKISMAGYAVSRPLPPHSVMCVCIGATIGKVGMSTKTYSTTNQQINSIICSERHDPRFMYYFLLHHAAYWRGFATYGTMPMLSKGAFEKISVYVPSDRDEQSDIADALVAVDDKIEVAGKKRNQLQDLFRTLLHELMTGKVRV